MPRFFMIFFRATAAILVYQIQELSVKLQIHPISVYWLLEELRAEGVRCKPEEQRLLEDRLTVIVLRLLGHRWPKQIEAGEPVPPWADKDGVIPLTASTGETTLADRLRARLRAEDGDLGAQQAEALLQELTGRTLEEWLRRDFFKRHISQFKKRPIAWHLASDPTAAGRKKSAPPAFECMVYYHATDTDILARIRTQYVDRLLGPAQRDLAQARRDGDETTAAQATALIQELEDFAQRLRQVEEAGFACKDLDEYVEDEPLDRWTGDGVFAARQPRRTAGPGAGVAGGHQRRRARQHRAPPAGRSAGRRRAGQEGRAQGHRRPRPLAIRRAALGARGQAAPLRLDGRDRAGKPEVDGARAGAGGGAAAVGGEASEGDG